MSERSKSKWIISISVARLRAATAAGSSAGCDGGGVGGGVGFDGGGGCGAGSSGCALRQPLSARTTVNATASVCICRFITLLTLERFETTGLRAGARATAFDVGAWRGFRQE